MISTQLFYLRQEEEWSKDTLLEILKVSTVSRDLTGRYNGLVRSKEDVACFTQHTANAHTCTQQKIYPDKEYKVVQRLSITLKLRLHL